MSKLFLLWIGILIFGGCYSHQLEFYSMGFPCSRPMARIVRIDDSFLQRWRVRSLQSGLLGPII